jgi:hypothetical protein
MSPRRCEGEPLGCSEREIVGVFVRENMMTLCETESGRS